jgi:ribosome-associated toxin RatA of RatAB toxin-antitoxin module
MRFLKLGLISFAFLSIVVTALSMLLPSTINISRAIDVQAPKDRVYNLVNDFDNWNEWYDNYQPSEVTFPGVVSGKGATVIMGKTKVSHLESSSDRIQTRWETPNDTLIGEFNFYTNSPGQTTIQWHFSYKVKWYPWEKFASIVSDKTIGGSMEKSLDNLKKAAEK